MGSRVSGLAEAVLGVAEGVGLSSDTVARYGKCCEAVVEFCDRQDVDACQSGWSMSSSRARTSVRAAVRSDGTGGTLW
jgi:hypothetical protein